MRQVHVTEEIANRGIYDDFPGCRLSTEDELNCALKSALVVVDTNVLLNLYRYSKVAQNDLLLTLRSLGDRLWVPHQVIREFWRRRLSVITSQGSATQDAVAALHKPQRATSDAINRWAKVTAISEGERKALVEKTEGLYAELEYSIKSHAPAERAIAGKTYDEPVLRELENLLANKVGAEPSSADWQAAVKEGKARITRKEPPGYLDADKADSDLPEGAAGDYLVWRQTLHEAARRNMDVLFVTGDEKEDWWWRCGPELLGPRVELVAEVRNVCGHRLFMMRPTDLLKHAAETLHVDVHGESVDDAERVSREHEAPEPTPPHRILDDEDPTWDLHTGLDGHRIKPEWDPRDLEQARAFYEGVRGKAKVFLDLLIDHPGRMLTVDELCTLSGGVFNGSHSVAGAVSGLYRAYDSSGRRYPFYWWSGNPTTYAMKPTVAALFDQVRSTQP